MTEISTLEKDKVSKPVLYIVVRDDMDSMSLSRGRSGAQISHATSAFHNFIDGIKKKFGEATAAALTDDEERALALYNIWAENPDNIGVVVILRADDGKAMMELHDVMVSKDVMTGVYEDTSYAVRDGTFVHYVSVPTTMWIFIDKNSVKADVLSDYKLF